MDLKLTDITTRGLFVLFVSTQRPFRRSMYINPGSFSANDYF